MQIYDNDLRYKQIQNKMMNMPQWAKAEHMEMSVPEKELWRYSGDAMRPSQKHQRRRGVLLTLTMEPDFKKAQELLGTDVKTGLKILENENDGGENHAEN